MNFQQFQHCIVCISKITRKRRALENASIFDFTLDGNDDKTLVEFDNEYRTARLLAKLHQLFLQQGGHQNGHSFIYVQMERRQFKYRLKYQLQPNLFVVYIVSK